MKEVYVCKPCGAEFPAILDYTDHYVLRHLLTDPEIQRRLKEDVERRKLEAPSEFKEYIRKLVELGKEEITKWAGEQIGLYLSELEKITSKIKSKKPSEIERDIDYALTLLGYSQFVTTITEEVLRKGGE